MSNFNPQTLSGKIKTVPPSGADTGRYQFLNLQNSEPNLGLPVGVLSPSSTFLLASDQLTGTRYWTTSANFAIKNNNSGFGTETPNEKVTVVGNISATGFIYGNFVALSSNNFAAGKTTHVQFNSGGILAANPGFIYDQSLSAIVVGYGNTSTGLYGSVLGGSINTVNGTGAAVVGGSNNVATNQFSVIGGGNSNATAGDYSVIGGGLQNDTTATYSVVVGGEYNAATGYADFVGAGSVNSVGGLYSAIVGGLQNNVVSDYSGILGGQNNLTQKTNTFILGSNMTATTANYTYVNNISSQGMVTAKNVSIGINSTANALTVVGNISATGTIYGILQSTSGLPGGSNNMVQFNDSNMLGGDKAFTYDKSTSAVQTKTLNTTTLGFSALSANQILLTSSITATSAFFTILIGASSFAIPLYRY